MFVFLKFTLKKGHGNNDENEAGEGERVALRRN